MYKGLSQDDHKAFVLVIPVSYTGSHGVILKCTRVNESDHFQWVDM